MSDLNKIIDIGLGGAAMIAGILMMVAPITEVLKRTTQTAIQSPNKKPIVLATYFAMLLNFSLWTLYGFYKPLVFVCIQNFVGVALSLFYFYRFYFSGALDENQRKQVQMAIFAFVLGNFAVHFLQFIEIITADLLGWCSTITAIALFAAPLVSLVRVLACI